jgi:hypothetical protein
LNTGSAGSRAPYRILSPIYKLSLAVVAQQDISKGEYQIGREVWNPKSHTAIDMMPTIGTSDGPKGMDERGIVAFNVVRRAIARSHVDNGLAVREQRTDGDSSAS